MVIDSLSMYGREVGRRASMLAHVGADAGVQLAKFQREPCEFRSGKWMLLRGGAEPRRECAKRRGFMRDQFRTHFKSGATDLGKHNIDAVHARAGHRTKYQAASIHERDRRTIRRNLQAARYTRVRMPRSLVTGGAGFLGSHLCDRLLAAGHHVTCLDNLFTGHYDNIRHLEGRGDFRFVKGDVTEPFDFLVDQIWNLACPAAPGHYRYDPVKTLRTSVWGVHGALQLAQKHGARIFHASTSEVYGDPSVHPQPESYRGNVNPIGPRACYDEGKRAAETLCFDFRRMHGTQIKVARIFNTYGPRMHPYDGRVVSNFVRQAIQGEALTIYGDGKQSRSFCFVEDLINGFMKLMESPAEFTGPVNLGNPVEFTMLELASMIAGQLGRQDLVEHRELPVDDPVQRQPDISLAKKELGWTPTVPLAEGLRRTIEWFKSIDMADYPPPSPYVTQPEAQKVRR